jgi:hypothetical protein
MLGLRKVLNVYLNEVWDLKRQVGVLALFKTDRIKGDLQVNTLFIRKLKIIFFKMEFYQFSKQRKHPILIFHFDELSASPQRENGTSDFFILMQ